MMRRPQIDWLIAATTFGLATVACFILYPALAETGRSQAAHPPAAVDLEALKMAYQAILEKITHYEDMLVTIGTVSLAILAGAGGVVFSTDFRGVSDPTKDKKRKRDHLVYFGILVLTSLTTLAYTHVFRYYAASCAYACELEMRLTADSRARAIAGTWREMSRPSFPSADFTFLLIGLYSAAISFATIFLFGRRFHQLWTLQVFLAAGLMLLTLAYVVPAVSYYLAMASLARQ